METGPHYAEKLTEKIVECAEEILESFREETEKSRPVFEYFMLHCKIIRRRIKAELKEGLIGLQSPIKPRIVLQKKGTIRRPRDNVY